MISPKVSALLIVAGVAACATPGQVRRVETQVAVLDRDHVRSDSAHAAELARIRATQRETMDSINRLMAQLNDNVQRVSREDAGNFESLRQQLYQVANLTSSTQSRVASLGTRIETGLQSAPPPAAVTPGDTTHPAANSVTIPPPDVLLSQGSTGLEQSAFGSARMALKALLDNYPSSPQVADALFMMGRSYDPNTPDSARVYYIRVWKEFPNSPRAPTALYKLAELERKANNTAAARGYYQQIVDKYKQSDEYRFAQDALRDMP
ncbi:MAG TPA: tetratricopeptide repeat protein [Gemmatimonadales bacterium]